MSVMFLFGSGADSDENASLESGKGFIKPLLSLVDKSEVESLQGKNARNYRLIHRNSTKIFTQTILNNEEKAKVVFGDSVVNKIRMYSDYSLLKGESDKVRGWYKKWYDMLTRGEDSPIATFFLENAVLFEVLDEKFNSLRNTNPLDANAKRVINAYTGVFVHMVKALYNFEDGFEWSFENLYYKLRTPYEYDKNQKTSYKSYYAALKESKLDYTVATTNYTSLVENILGKEVIYLHGKLTWFEDLKRLTVYDCTVDNELEWLKNADIVIPYILIPSGVKPLICKKQIMEFSSFATGLDKSDLLVVVGYKFNSEDNHINSIIGDWLSENNHEMIYLNYNDSIDFSEMGWSKPHLSKIKVYETNGDSEKARKEFENIIKNIEN